MIRVVSTVQMEHALPILADLDLGPLLEAFAGASALPQQGGGFQVSFSPNQLTTLAPLLGSLGKAGAAKVLRRLAAVCRATDDELLEAECSPAKLAAMNLEAARLPLLDNVMEVFVFFASLGLSASPTPASSDEVPMAEEAVDPPTTEGTIPSVDS